MQLFGAAIGANIVGVALNKFSFNPAINTLAGVAGAAATKGFVTPFLPPLPNSGAEGTLEFSVVLTAFGVGAALGAVIVAILTAAKSLTGKKAAA
ncbi:MAG: hypothetical protein C3F11_16055 [Methylocystaceae bacterium]|nr:MAG: hypothetical protein C3F11_16055 [Methylocystaceae bacterium]